MNAFLLSIGIALAVVLSAALAAPMIVDWNAYRGVVEEQASRIIGRPVAIEGDLEVRLVPFPGLRATNVRIGGGDSEEGVAALSARGGLMPLLSGEVHLSELTLDRPELHFSVSPDGFVAWGVESEPATIPVAPGQVRVDEFGVLDGRIVIEDARTGSRYVAEDLDLAGNAATLAGPYKFDGAGTVEGERYGLRVALGRLQPDGAVRVGATIRPQDRSVVATLDGNLGYEEGQPSYRGMLVVENVVLETAETADGEPATDEEREGGQHWRFDASTVASPESLVFGELSLRVGEAEHPITLTGAAQIQFGRDPHFQAVLSSRQIDVDRALGGGSEAPIRPHAAVAALADLVATDLLPIEGRLSVDVASLVVGGNIVQSLGAELLFEEAHWRIGRAEAMLPGRTDAALSGRVFPEDGQPRFEGAVTVASDQASPLAAWLFGQEAHLPGLGEVAGSLRASAAVELDPEGFSLERLDVATDRNRLAGSVAYAADEERRRLDIALKTDELDVRGLPLERLADAVRGRLPGGDAAGAIDLAIDLEADELVGGTVAAQGVRARGLLAGDELRVDQLEITDVAGLSLSASGRLSNLSAHPTGRIELKVSGEDLDSAADAAARLGYDELSSIIESRRGAISPLAATFVVSSGTEGSSRGIDLHLEGAMAGTELEGQASIDGGLATLDEAPLQVDLRAQNEDAAALFSQLGFLPMAADGAAELTLSGGGTLRDGVDFRLAGEGMPISGAAEGRIAWPEGAPRALTAELALRLEDVALLLAPLGLSPLVEPTDAGDAWARLAATGERYEIENFSYDGLTRLGGSLVLETGDAPRLAGSLDADAIALDRLVQGAVGVKELLQSPFEGQPSWSQEPFALSDATSLQVDLSVAAPEASWEQLALSDVSFRFSSGQGTAGIRGFSGRIWDGRLEADLELRTLRGALDVAARLQLNDAAIGQFVWHDGGRPVATGRLDLGLDLTGAGRTPSSLVASLAGEGSFVARDGTVRSLDPDAFAAVLAAVEEGLAVEQEPVAALFADELEDGALSYRSSQGAIAANEGVLRVGRVKLDAPAAGVFASGVIDLPKLAVSSDWTLRAAESGDQRALEASLTIEGPITDPRRSVNVDPLLSHLTVRQFEQEVQRLEDLQAEILERERLGRELLHLGRQRRARERALEAEAADPAAEAPAAETPGGNATAEGGGEATAPAAETAPPAPSSSAADEAVPSLDREEFRRTIQDLLRGVDGGSERSAVPEVPAAVSAVPVLRPTPAAGTRRPLDITPGAR